MCNHPASKVVLVLSPSGVSQTRLATALSGSQCHHRYCIAMPFPGGVFKENFLSIILDLPYSQRPVANAGLLLLRFSVAFASPSLHSYVTRL
jgi:hypothetical protein